MQSREFTVGLWLPNWRSKVDDPFIESTCAHSTQRIQWLKYIRISIRPNPRECECRGLSIGAAYSSHQSSGFSRACGRTRVSPFSTLPDRIVPFAPPSGTATLPAFATRSPISPSRSTAIPHCFSTESNAIPLSPSLPLSPSSYATLPRLSSICRAASRHLFASDIPSANLWCNARIRTFAKRIQRARVICFPMNSREDRRCRRGFTEDSGSRVFSFDLVIEDLQTIFLLRQKREEFEEWRLTEYSLIFLTNIDSYIYNVSYLFCILPMAKFILSEIH